MFIYKVLGLRLTVTKLINGVASKRRSSSLFDYKLLMPFLHEAIEKLIGNSLKTFAPFFPKANLLHAFLQHFKMVIGADLSTPT